MKKPPIPTFVAAYPAPSKTNWTLIIIVLIVVAIGAYIYFDSKNKPQLKPIDEVKPNITEPTEESIKSLPSGSIFSVSNSCPIGSTAVSSGFSGGFMCIKD